MTDDVERPERAEATPQAGVPNVFKVTLDAFWRFSEDDGWAIASHIALSAITSLFPFLIFVTALAGFIGSQNLAAEASDLIMEAWPEQVAEPIAAEIHNVVTGGKTGLLTFSAVLALYFSSNGIEALRIALNRAYGLKETRVWWKTRLESIGYVLIAALSLLALAFLVVLGPTLWEAVVRAVPGLEPYEGAVTALRLGVATLVIVATLIALHLWLPCGQRRLVEILPGVLVTVALSLGYGLAFAFYLRRATENYVATYAGLASIMIALVFLYTVAATFIYGGEFNAVLMKAEGTEVGGCKRTDA